jgi:ribonuclease M5
MLKLREAVIVEGKYDKIRLSNIIDAVIIPVNGFHIFKDAETISLIRYYAISTGIIILTDSDTAGFKIRNFVKNCVKNCVQNTHSDTPPRIINVYIPDVFGKERRKISPSKEGKLGVEGIADSVIIEALKNAGITADETPQKTPGETITKTDLYLWGLSGTEKSSSKRRALQKKLGLPELLSASALIDILNAMYSKSECIKILDGGI